MKILIWFLTILVAGILNFLLIYTTGFKAGFILWIGIFFVAKKLCNMWTEHKQNKVDSNILTKMALASEAPKISFCRKCGYELIGNSDFCSNCGTLIPKE